MGERERERQVVNMMQQKVASKIFLRKVVDSQTGQGVLEKEEDLCLLQKISTGVDYKMVYIFDVGVDSNQLWE